MPPVERTSKSLFFFVCSMLLVLSIGWSLWDEIKGRRPWKDYQAEFNRLEGERVRDELKAETAKVSGGLAKLTAAIQKAEEDLASNAAYAAAKNRLAATREKFEKVSLENKFIRSERDEAYYEYKHAIHEGGAATAEKVHFDALNARADVLGKRESRFMGEDEKIFEEIAGMEKSLSDLKDEKSKLGNREDASKRRLATIQGRVSAIQQVVLTGIEVNNFEQPLLTVDRCQTCHLGVDRRGFDKFPAPFKTHPNRSLLLGKHPVGKFGCTLCHGGQGPALNSLTKAHGIDLETGKHLKFWEAPLLRGDEIQTNCLKCHSRTLDIPEAPVVSKGKRLFLELGCHGCHLLEGYENIPKVGPTLLKASEKFRPEWMVPWILEPRKYLPKTGMPYFALTRAQATAISAYLVDASKKLPPSGPYKFNPGPNRRESVKRGKRLFETRGCLACHNIDGKGGTHGPDLSRVAMKVKPDWVVNWLKNPRHYDPGTVMPSLKLPDVEAQAIASYLLTRGKPARPDVRLAARMKDLAVIKEGRRLVETYGCYGCHDIEKTAKLGRLSVELTTFANKSPGELDFGDVTEIHEEWEAWVFAKLKNPRIFSTDRIDLRMPNFYLSDKNTKALRTFLRRWNGHEMSGKFVRKLSPREAALERGRRLVEKYNCVGCHVIEGKGGFVRRYYKDKALAPPILTGEGAKVQPKWLFSFLKKPIPLRPALNDGIWMPKFGLTDEEAADLVRYFMAQDKKLDLKTPYQFTDPYQFVSAERRGGPEGKAAVGKFIFQKFQCLECHQQVVKAGQSLADLAPDLAMAQDRLRPDWILEWLKDPQKIQAGTRMPSFFSDGESPLENVWKGNARKQIVALRDYLLNFDGGKGEVKGIPKGVITASEEDKDEDDEDEDEEDEDEDDEDEDD